MDARDVIDALARFEDAGIHVCVDGGWGVDALIGEQTRPHRDLDLALDREQLERARSVLSKQGFHAGAESEPGLPARLVLKDPAGRQIDLHPLVFDDRGDGWQQLSPTGKAWGRYPAEDLAGSGTIAGRPVRCLSAALQFRFHLGYEWSAEDEHDLALLSQHLGLSRPPGLGSP